MKTWHEKYKAYYWILALVLGYSSNIEESPVSVHQVYPQVESFFKEENACGQIKIELLEAIDKLSQKIDSLDTAPEDNSEDPIEEPEDVSEKAVILDVFDEYKSSLKVVFFNTSNKIKSGDFTNDIETNKYIHEESKKVREEAFRLLNNEAEKFGGESWTKDKAYNFWKKQEEAL